MKENPVFSSKEYTVSSMYMCICIMIMNIRTHTVRMRRNFHGTFSQISQIKRHSQK